MKQHSFSAPLALGDGSADRLQRPPQSSQGRVLPVKFSPSPGETSGNLRLVSTDTMASADFSAFTPPITGRGAAVLPPPHVSEISPGKEAARPRTAAAFTSTTEPVGSKRQWECTLFNRVFMRSESGRIVRTLAAFRRIVT